MAIFKTEGSLQLKGKDILEMALGVDQDSFGRTLGAHPARSYATTLNGISWLTTPNNPTLFEGVTKHKTLYNVSVVKKTQPRIPGDDLFNLSTTDYVHCHYSSVNNYTAMDDYNSFKSVSYLNYNLWMNGFLKKYIKLLASFNSQLNDQEDLSNEEVAIARQIFSETAIYLLTSRFEKVSVELTYEKSLQFVFKYLEYLFFFERYIDFEGLDEVVYSVFNGKSKLPSFGGSYNMALKGLNEFIGNKVTYHSIHELPY